MEHIALARHPVKWDYGDFRERISTEANSLANVKFSGLPRNIELIKASLCGSAILNDRDTVSKDDFDALTRLKRYFGWQR